LLTNYTREQPGKAIQTQNTTPTRFTWATVRGPARANLVSKGWGAPFCYLSGHDGRRGPGSLQESPREKTHFKAKSIKDVLVSISHLVLNKVILSSCFREVLQISTQGKTKKIKMKCNTNNASSLVHKIWAQVLLFFLFLINFLIIIFNKKYLGPFQFLDVATTLVNPQEELAKFGYSSDWEVEKL
jgi:hypothetical protein